MIDCEKERRGRKEIALISNDEDGKGMTKILREEEDESSASFYRHLYSPHI